MKKLFTFLTVLMVIAMMGCQNNTKPTAESDQMGPGDESETLAAYDMVILEDGKLVFYHQPSTNCLTFTAETDSVVNAVYASNDILYYSVSVNGDMILKSLKLDEKDPKPVKLADWGVKVDDCHGAFPPHAENLGINKDETAIAMFHESYMFTRYAKLSVYDIQTGEVTVQTLMEYDPETDIIDEAYDASFDFRTSPWPDDALFETDNRGSLYYLGGEGKVCLSDKLDYVAMFNSEPGYLDDDEIYTEPIAFNPDMTQLLFQSYVLWSEYGIGSYCVADLDGSKQLDLKADIFSKFPSWLRDGSLVFIRIEDGMFDIPMPEDFHTMIMYSDGTIQELSKSANYAVKPFNFD